MSFIDKLPKKLRCFLGLHEWHLDWTNAIKESEVPIPGKAYYADNVCKICKKKG